jgi:iron complex outermembrane receptor protein
MGTGKTVRCKKSISNHTQRWRYTTAGELSVLLFYSNLHYQTPGGLTLVPNGNQNPQQARSCYGNVLPGATEQQAAVYNKTVFAGISNEYKITSFS